MIRGGMVLIKDMGVLIMTERVISHMMRHVVMLNNVVLNLVMGCSVMIALFMVPISDVMSQWVVMLLSFMLEFGVVTRDVALHDALMIEVSGSVMVVTVIVSVIVVLFLFVTLIIT